MMPYYDRLTALRKAMQREGIQAYVIPSSDPHISEYLPDRYKCIAWISGFTGSAGTLVITADFAGLWTDGRYFVQAEAQLKGTGFELVKLKQQGVAEYVDWLSQRLGEGDVVAFDGKLASATLAKTILTTLGALKISVQGDVDLLDEIWEGRPALPEAPAYLIDAQITGKSTKTKLEEVRVFLAQKRVDAHVVSSLDDLAWLLNIRGSDVPCNPVVLGFLLITQHDAILYVDLHKLTDQDKQTLYADGIKTVDYHAVKAGVQSLPEGSVVLLDPARTCYDLYTAVAQRVAVVESMNPSTWMKAVKNETEIQHMRHTMVLDGVALTLFFKWLEESLGNTEITELSLAEKLKSFRAAQEGFVGESFTTIAGYKANGALPHYSATKESDAVLGADGLLLVDSGGQYYTGTTDITRVVSLGNITAEQRKDYTLVLKSMIEGSSTNFVYGTKGYQIDGVTRRPLWDHFRNYGHGTGHGIGFFLNVHEGPHVFNAANINVTIEPGMITSIEPGLYREGEYGIRIENLVLSHVAAENQFGTFMSFETLTLCYIDTDLIDKTLLEPRHVEWLNAYHEQVYSRLSVYLSAGEKQWLAEKTRAI